MKANTSDAGYGCLERETATLAQKATSAGLPHLCGTPEQIRYAEIIRAELLESAVAVMSNSWHQTNELDKSLLKEHNLRVLHILGQILVQVRLEPSAAWWIAHRCDDGYLFLRRVYQERNPRNPLL